MSLMELFSFTLLLHKICLYFSHLGQFQVLSINHTSFILPSAFLLPLQLMLPLSSPQCLSLGLLNSLLICLLAASLAPSNALSMLQPNQSFENTNLVRYLLAKIVQPFLWLQVPLVRIKSRILMIRFL